MLSVSALLSILSIIILFIIKPLKKAFHNIKTINAIKTDIQTTNEDQSETRRELTKGKVQVEINNEKNVGINDEKIKEIIKNEEIKNSEKIKEEIKIGGKNNEEIKNEDKGTEISLDKHNDNNENKNYDNNNAINKENEEKK